MEILERRPKTEFARPIRLENTIQRRLIPRHVPRGRAQHVHTPWKSSLSRRTPSPGRGVAAGKDPSRNSSIASSSRVLRSIASAAEIRAISRRQSPKKLVYSTKTRRRPRVCLSASRVYFSHKALESSGDVSIERRERPADLLRVAHRNHGHDVESGQTRRLEPHAGQRRYLQVLDDHERRGRQRSEKRPGCSAMQAAFSSASNAPSSCRRSVGSKPSLPWRRRIASLRTAGRRARSPNSHSPGWRARAA